MSLYRLKRGVHYHQGRRIAANSKTGGNVVDLPDDHPSLKEVDRWERVGASAAGAGSGEQTTAAQQQTGGAPQHLPASGPTQEPASPAHNASEVLTSETVRGGAIPGVTEPLVGAGSTGASASTSEDGTDAGATTGDGSGTPTRDWYTYTIPQAVQHVRSASDLTTLAQYKNLELAPKVGKQRGKVLEAIDERAGELRKEG